MSAQQRPYIGIISDCALQRHVLQSVLSGYGLNIALTCDPSLLADQRPERIAKVDCWILELEGDPFEFEALACLIDDADRPILFGLGKAPSKQDESYISWERRLLTKLAEHIGRVEVLESEATITALEQPLAQAHEQQPLSPTEPHSEAPALTNRPIADQVWVLAASLGGPAAVKEFLDAMPSDIKVGFLYAQHVDAHFSSVLTKVLGRHAKLALKAMQQGDQIREGEVLVVPVDREIVFGAQGVTIRQNPWSGPYGPSIDQLLLNLLNYYGQRCHALVFSGMGNDGAMAAPKMKRQGCSIWTQTPDSCANGSMPQSIIDLDCSDFSGTPKELAQAFIEQLGGAAIMSSRATTEQNSDSSVSGEGRPDPRSDITNSN